MRLEAGRRPRALRTALESLGASPNYSYRYIFEWPNQAPGLFALMNRAHATERAAHGPQGETLPRGKKFPEEGLLFHPSAHNRSVHIRSRRHAMYVLAFQDLLLQRIEEFRILFQRLAGLLTPLPQP